VPWDYPYIGSYPHAVELWDLGARSLMHDDRWLDVAQLPLCLCGAAAVAGLARRAKAPGSVAVAAGALWLCLPAIFLQLPTAYVDVASASFFLLAAYWILGNPSLPNAVLGALSLGLFLGSKPAAPIAVAMLGIGFAARCLQPAKLGLPIVAGLLTLAVGGESYIANFARHANPLWPIALDLGPLHFPGRVTLAEVLHAGAAAPHLTGNLPERMFRGWTALFAEPAFDMRVGGFGPLFLLILPVGLWGALRRRGLWIVALAASL